MAETVEKVMLSKALEFAERCAKEARRAADTKGESERSYHAGRAGAFEVMAGILRMTEGG
jgi:hypothetical protein